MAEYSGGNILQRRYVHGPGSDEPVVAYEGSTLTSKRWLHADERGSITAVTNSTGTSVATNKYDEYGNPAATNAAVSNGGRFGYTGQAWLPELGMWYYKARVYNPALGRFMQSDPIGYADGMNAYNYVGGDPVNGVDPSGRCRFTIWGIFEHEKGKAPKTGKLIDTYVEQDSRCDTLGLDLLKESGGGGAGRTPAQIAADNKAIQLRRQLKELQKMVVKACSNNQRGSECSGLKQLYLAFHNWVPSDLPHIRDVLGISIAESAANKLANSVGCAFSVATVGEGALVQRALTAGTGAWSCQAMVRDGW